MRSKEFLMLRLLKNLCGLNKRHFHSSKKLNKTRLGVETLENRLVPTVVFQPVFGAESVNNHHDGLQNPPVTVIFSGSFWNSDNEKPLLDGMQRIMGGAYLIAMTQYGSDGMAHFQNSWETNS